MITKPTHNQETAPSRCAIYARFSSDLQRLSSIEDQIRNCREAAESNGWVIVEDCIRSDQATSGQSLVGRDGMEQLLALAKQSPRPFDGILIDDTSRFGRNLSDTLPLSDRLKYQGVFLYSVNRRLDSRDANFRTLFIFSGQQDESFSRSLGEKVHRGMRGRVLDGFIANGQTFGYKNVPIENPNRKGLHGRPYVEAVQMVIDPVQAAVVLRIFECSASGLGAAATAAILNQDGVPSPLQSSRKLKRVWCKRTISKILTNDKYRGMHIWNRTKVVINPETGRKEQHPRPESEWERVEKPEWRIISEELWAAKDAAHKLRSQKYFGLQVGGFNRTGPGREYIFSGRIFCDLCGSKMTIIGGTGKSVRYGCHSRRFRGATICNNSSSILQRELQTQLVDALCSNLLDTSLQRQISQEFHRQLKVAIDEAERKEHKLPGEEADLKDKLAQFDREAENIVDAMTKFGGVPILCARLDSTMSQKSTVEKLLAAKQRVLELVPSNVDTEAFLAQKMNDLAAVLTDDPFLAKQEIQKRVKELRLRPVMTPDGLTFEVTGDVSLFTRDDDVMQGTSSYQSSLHYTSCSMPFSATIHQNPKWAESRALKRAA